MNNHSALRIPFRALIGLFLLTALYFAYNRTHVAASSSVRSEITGLTNAAEAMPLPNPHSVAETVFPSMSQAGCPIPNFAPAPTSPELTGDNPLFVDLADFNGDNHLDIASTNFNADSVTIMLGDGTGSFTDFGEAIPVGNEPVTVETGDLNNDGKQDLAVCNQASNDLHVFLGVGDGTFTAAPGSPITVGVAPRAVVKGHFNADNFLDLVTTNGESNDLTILLGNGNGTFTNSTLASSFAPFHAVVENLNGDAHKDLAVANLGSGSVSIFLGNGLGGFTQFGSDILVGSFTSYIAAGLYNADANLDLAVTNRANNNVVILLGNGSGGFSPAAGSPYFAGLAPMGIAAGDLNLDGILDLAVSNEGSANTTILLGNGLGGFGTQTTVSKGQLPTSIALADINEDNKLDIATSDGGSDTITILLNTCSNCAAITVNPAAIGTGTVNAGYSATFTASGGTSPHQFSMSGTLPTGLALSGPTLSGLPTESGSFPVTVTATDSFGCASSRTYMLTINCQNITVNPGMIASGTVGAFYNQSFTETGGFGATNFDLTGNLPAGLSFSGTTLSGTPTEAGNFPIMITATDSNGCTGSRSYTLTINCQTISILPPTIPAGTAGAAYSQNFTANGAIGSVGFVQNGKLPSGLSFSGATLSGTPTQTGSFPISITATDANNCSTTRNYTLTINCQTMTITPTTIPAGTVNAAYSQSFSQTGGIGSMTFTQSGKLPTGMSFASPTLSGTPTQSGSFPISITATDANGCSVTRNFTLTINCQTITVNPATIAGGTVGQSYSQSFTQTGGIGAVNFSLTGALPSGLNLAGATLSGIPTQSGSFPITVIATDANGCSGIRNYTLVIGCQGFTITPPTLPPGTLGALYSQTFSHTGGKGAVSFTLSGTLPIGLNLVGATLSGAPAQIGNFPINVIATDSNGCLSMQSYSLTINAPSSGLMFYRLPTPIRLLDTRTGQAACSTPGAQISGGTSHTQSAAGFCSIPSNAKAVVGNVTTFQSGGGFMTLYPSDATRPTVANSNYVANEVLTNVFTVGLGAADGAFNIFVTSNTHVAVDIVGYYAPPAPTGLYYHKLPKPIRLLETRPGFTGCFAPATPLPGGVDTTQQGITTCDNVTIPGAAKALYGNATTVSPVAAGSLTLFAADILRPTTTNGNYTANQVLNSPFTVALSASGHFKIFPTQQTHLVIDIHGYFSEEAADVNGQGLLFNPLPTPVRLLDTRIGFGGCFTPGAPLQAGVEQSQPARATCTIGATAQAIVGNATVVNNPATGFLTLWPSDATRPTVASSNWTPNKVFNRFFTVGLGANGNFKMYAHSGTDLVVDVSGYFAP
ncbi:MAG: putative Ig domain-containing protein [Blastocatellia bacterium]